MVIKKEALLLKVAPKTCQHYRGKKLENRELSKLVSSLGNIRICSNLSSRIYVLAG